MKKILVAYYSQSGQLKQIAENLVAPFHEKDFDVEWLEIGLKKDFPFPWTGNEFYDVMPECVLGIPTELKPVKPKSDRYDLIIFAYQPWFLSPSIPATSLLKDPDFRKVLNGTPVVTLIGSRNSWIMAQKQVIALLNESGANLVGNVVLEDRNTNLVSAVTIQYWLYTGKKDRLWGVLPKPGVSDDDIKSAQIFGSIVANSLLNSDLQNLQQKLIDAKALAVHANLLFVELRGSFLFSIWAKLILQKKNRGLWVKVFEYYLLIALFLVSPIVLFFYTIFFKPFLRGSISKSVELYLRAN